MNLINILKELFPDNLDLSSNLFPRFNFRISNCIYFAIGDSGQKFKNPQNYTHPSDYNPEECISYDISRCSYENKKNKLISNHELCKIDDEICTKNNVNQYKLLNSKDFNNKTTKEIYSMINQTDIYDKLLEKNII